MKSVEYCECVGGCSYKTCNRFSEEERNFIEERFSKKQEISEKKEKQDMQKYYCETYYSI